MTGGEWGRKTPRDISLPRMLAGFASLLLGVILVVTVIMLRQRPMPGEAGWVDAMWLAGVVLGWLGIASVTHDGYIIARDMLDGGGM